VQPVSKKDGSSPEEECSPSWAPTLFFMGVSSILVGLMFTVDIVKAGMTWGRAAGLVPAVVTLIFIQAKYHVVGPPNVRRDE
jgi:hypothetical protein